MAEAYGTDLNRLCAERGWSRADFMAKLRTAATSTGSSLPNDTSLSRMIRMWAKGDRGLSKQHAALLSDTFGLRFEPSVVAAQRPAKEPMPAASALIATATQQSADLIDRVGAAVEALSIEQYAADIARLAAEYMNSPPLVMAYEAKLLRDRLMVAQERTRRPSQLADLYHLAGRASGILAYAALDLGDPRAAMTNARGALACADLAGHTGLTAWVRGTQSLIARFAGRHAEAERYALAGMDLNPRGTAHARLAAGQAQCRAQLGDVAGTQAALDLASDSHSSAPALDAADDETGLFGFPRSKVHYYAASSLVCLPAGAGAVSAAREAEVAIRLFRQAPVDERFITDEVLVHIHGASAHLQRGHLDAAAQFLGPVFTTPVDQRVSWHRQRLAALAPLLSTASAKGSPKAMELRAKIAHF